jgi:hypothetical protein
MDESEKKSLKYYDFMKFYKEKFSWKKLSPKHKEKFIMEIEKYLKKKDLLHIKKLEKLKEILMAEIGEPWWKIIPIKSFIPVALLLIVFNALINFLFNLVETETDLNQLFGLIASILGSVFLISCAIWVQNIGVIKLKFLVKSIDQIILEII